MKTKKEILAEIKFTLVNKHNIDALDDSLINDCVEMTLKAINYTHCCKSDSEQLFCDCYIKYPRGDGDCRRCGLPAKP